MVRISQYQQSFRAQQECPFAVGNAPLHTNWTSGRDPVSGLAHAAPATSSARGPQHPGSIASHHSHLPPASRAPPPATGSNSLEALPRGDSLDQFAGKTQRDIIWEQKHKLHMQKRSNVGQGAASQNQARAGRRGQPQQQQLQQQPSGVFGSDPAPALQSEVPIQSQ